VTSRAIQALGLTQEQFAELRRMLPARKVEAVKRFCEITGFGLAEAKAAIDAIEAGVVPGGGPPVSERPSWEAELYQGVKAIGQQSSNVSLYQASAIANLAGVLPEGSRSPTPEEAVEITRLIAGGDEAGAAARLGALFGLDPATAEQAAARLRFKRRGPKGLFAGIAIALTAFVAWVLWSVITQ
jgi:hypothetical protein